jgi:LysM repeat protein
LADIGARFGVAWETIAAANNLTAATVLNIGQELVIPAAGAALPATATPRPLPTWTRTPAPPSAPPPPSLAAPLLSNPADGTPYSGDQAVLELVWQAVEGMSANGQYQVTLRWAENGAPQEHLIYTTATGIRVPTWLWQKADRPTRQYTWFVTAITKTTDGKGGERVIPLSPPSAARTFSWN